MKPSVLIELDKPRNIRLNTKALVLAEDLMGKPINALQNGVGVGEVTALLWAGLIHEDDELGIDDVYDLVDEKDDFEYISEKVFEAFRLASGKKGQEVQGLKTKKKASGKK